MTLDRKSAKAYLLGFSSKTEAERIEQLLLEDEKAPEVLFAIEGELIEDYLEGNLPEAERIAFESHFLDSEERREQVTEISMLKRLASGEHRAATEPQPEPKKGSNLRFWLFIAVITITLALLLFAGWRFFGLSASRGGTTGQQFAGSGPPGFCYTRDLAILTV
jgi:anti-sigma factor RsiW